MHGVVDLRKVDVGPGLSAARTEDSAGPALDMVAIEELRQLAGDDAAFVGELIDTYLGDAAERIGEMLDALIAGDHHGLQALAHALRGSSFAMGASEVGDACRALEQTRSPETSEQRMGRVERVRMAVERVIPLLAELRESRPF